ncbi:hypothetical protein ACFFX0_08895 [Citricoccus parietis]|uniref:Uncharacterized protein n=1 Tax=Citricoccus parietis TaxID=592307 RepID=A0ABV5FX89_9MICC
MVPDHAVGPGHGGHHERLPVPVEEGGGPRVVGQVQPDRLGHAAGMQRARGDDGQRGARAVPDVLEHQVHGPVDLGHGGFHALVAGTGHAGPAGQEFHPHRMVGAGQLGRAGQHVQRRVVELFAQQTGELALQPAVHGGQPDVRQHPHQGAEGRVHLARQQHGGRRVHGDVEGLR